MCASTVTLLLKPKVRDSQLGRWPCRCQQLPSGSHSIELRGPDLSAWVWGTPTSRVLQWQSSWLQTAPQPVLLDPTRPAPGTPHRLAALLHLPGLGLLSSPTPFACLLSPSSTHLTNSGIHTCHGHACIWKSIPLRATEYTHGHFSCESPPRPPPASPLRPRPCSVQLLCSSWHRAQPPPPRPAALPSGPGSLPSRAVQALAGTCERKKD